MPKVLFISYDGVTDPLGQSQVIPYLQGLSKFDYEITILSCEKSENYLLHKKEVEKLMSFADLKWRPIAYHKKPAVFSTLFDIYQLQKKAKQLHAVEKFDMVHTRPGIPALVGLKMKKKFGIKFLNDIREFYADSRIDGGMWNKENFFYKNIYGFFKQKEMEAVSESDGIVCLTSAAEKIIKQWPEYKSSVLLKVIPCSVDMSLFDPEKIDVEKKENFKRELNITDDDFIVGYLGSIGSWYMIDEMMQFFKTISDKNAKAKFLFISPNANGVITKAARKYSLDEKKLVVKEVKRNDVPALLSFCKYSVFFIKPCYSKQSSSPTKHGEIMAMGIPVISNTGVGDVAEIIENYQSGIVLKNLNQDAFIKAANTISDNSFFEKSQIRKAALDFYDLNKAVKNYRIVYDQICKTNTNEQN